MALTFKNLQDLCVNFIDDDSSATLDDLKKYLNMAASDIWNRYPWDERKVRSFVTTYAPYTTGTVSVTNGSQTVTGSGTVFPSDCAGKKFSLGLGQPWYQIDTRDSDTQITLVDNYAEATASAQTYRVWDDRVSLPSDCVELLKLWYQDGDEQYELQQVSAARMDEWNHVPESADRPYWSMMETQASGVRRIRVGPDAPEGTRRIEILYLKSYTDMSADGDLCVVPESRRDIIIHGALAWMFKRDHYQRSRMEAQDFERKLQMAWRTEQDHRGPARLPLRPIRKGHPWRRWTIE